MGHLLLFKQLSVANIKSAMQYPVNFIFSTLSTFLMTIIDVIGLIFLFDRFGLIDNWSLGESLLLYGAVNTSFAIVEMVFRGFDRMGHYVRTGTLDILLVRPRPVFLMIFGLDFKLSNLGRIVNGLIPLFAGVQMVHINSAWQIALIGYALLLSGAVFFALLVIQASLTILGQTNIEFMNIFTYGGMQLVQFPLTIYSRYIVRTFTYLVPVGLVTFYPIASVLGKNIAHLDRYLWMGPMMTLFFIFVSLKFFDYSIKHYQSTGS